MKQRQGYGKSCIGPNGQRGALTIFSAALILILMTIVLVYATKVSIYETRVSGNEVRQKEAFHVAEAAIEQGMMYMLANTNVILSSRENVFPDGGNGTFTKDGWFSASNGKWLLCPTTPGLTHPCGGEVPAKAGSYYYDTDGNTATIESLPVDLTGMPTGSTARMGALLCFVDLSNTGANCGGPGSTAEDEANAALAVTLMGYGYSDCTDIDTLSTCIGRATVARPLGTDRKMGGTPAVPLVAKATLPLDGTFEVVGNPNGGGVGVPLTTWMDGTSDLLSAGTWQTCEMEEWYHAAEQPEGVACTDNNCMCGPGGNDTDYFLSWRGPGGDTHIDIDIVQDPDFPDDLFEVFFNVPRAQYQTIKSASKVLADCSTLGPGSSGFIWITGDCSIAGNSVIGSPLAPLVLITEGLTTINGGAVIFGVLYIFDGYPEGSNSAALKTTGSATVYGSVIVDAPIDKLQGTFQVVYNSGVLATATGYAGVGAMNGGWRDFGLPDIAW